MTDNEKTVLEKLYDELRAELSTTQLNCDMWHDRAEDMRNRLSAAQADNAKLRELVQDYEHCSMHADCGRCEYDGTTSTHCPLSPCFPDIDELRELGVDA